MNYKVCKKCNVEKEATLEFFHYEKNGKYNVRSICKICRRNGKKWKWEISLEKGIKECASCKKIKSTNQFSTDTNRKDCLNPYCNNCLKKKSKEFSVNNSEKRKEIANKYANSENGKLVRKIYTKKNSEKFKDYSKEYRIKNRDTINEKRREWVIKNYDKVLSYRKNYKNKNPEFFVSKSKKDYEKIKSDPLKLFTLRVRRGIHRAFKFSNKPKKTEQLLGCSIEEFRQYIISKFQQGMTLENHGRGIDKWHLDHIIPLDSAKSVEDVIKLNHYTNFQPLWETENLKKSNKI